MSSPFIATLEAPNLSNWPLYPVHTLGAGRVTTQTSVRLAFKTLGLHLP